MVISDAKAQGNKRHLEKLDRIVIQPYKEEGMLIRAAATAAGESLQGYILKACRMRMGKGESD